jgi:hypothetical protein
VLKALLAGGLATLASAVLTVHAEKAQRVPLTAIDVLHLPRRADAALPLTALPPGESIVVINKLHQPLELQGIARG